MPPHLDLLLPSDQVSDDPDLTEPNDHDPDDPDSIGPNEDNILPDVDTEPPAQDEPTTPVHL
jgi:hypothetical protein